ncbi:MAG: mandelate racemase/muconate lactonizing enzyme family protein [Pseudomonadota bacterium]
MNTSFSASHAPNPLAAITRVTVYVVVQSPPEYAWSPVMPEVLNTDTIVKVEDEDGFVGGGSVCTFTEFGADLSVAHSLRPLIVGLLNSQSRSVDDHWRWMSQRRPGVSNPALAVVDIALWDLLARRCGKPLYTLLGNARDQLPCYASVPVMDTPKQYIELISSLQSQGFGRFKFHYKSTAESDIALIEAVTAAFAHSDCQFMFDAEELYSEDAALAVAKVASDAEFLWLEAPFNDHDWAAYRRLQAQVDTPILPAGNSVVDQAHLAQAIDAQCWSALRIDAATAGGITPALGIFNLAKKAGLNVELQSWGGSFSTAANLHLALGQNNSTFFEVPVPRHDFDLAGCSRFPLEPDGSVHAPTTPGIGLVLDWPTIEATAAERIVFGR